MSTPQSWFGDKLFCLLIYRGIPWEKGFIGGTYSGHECGGGSVVYLFIFAFFFLFLVLELSLFWLFLVIFPTFWFSCLSLLFFRVIFFLVVILGLIFWYSKILSKKALWYLCICAQTF